jgi:hypothetical protein
MSSGLLHSPADVLRWLLISLRAGTNPDDGDNWPIFASNEPDSPDNLIVLYDTEGLGDGRVQRGGEAAKHHGVSVQVRGNDDPTTWLKMDEVAGAVTESTHNTLVDIGDDQYIVYAVTIKSGPIALGREPGTNRFLFTINVVAAIRQIT